jgi:hypothetical protein
MMGVSFSLSPCLLLHVALFDPTYILLQHRDDLKGQANKRKPTATAASRILTQAKCSRISSSSSK